MLGTYPITVTGNGGGIKHTTTVTLTVVGSAGLHAFGFAGVAHYRARQSGNINHHHHDQWRLQQFHQSLGFRHALGRDA